MFEDWTYEEFLSKINQMVKDGQIHVICPDCKEDITTNYLTPFNAGSTRCNKCSKFIDNEEILFLPVNN